MPTRGFLRTAARWVLANLAFEALGRAGVPHVRVRYESIVEDPTRSIDRVFRLVEERLARGQETVLVSAGGSKILQDRAGHTLGGNPMRFDRGPMKIRSDDEWRTRLPMSARLIVGVVCLPLLITYGYVPTRHRRAPRYSDEATSDRPDGYRRD